MIKNAFLKDGLRQIRATLHRFLSILIITALGVAFFAGLRATGPDMRLTASSYYDRLNFMDIRILSTVGFNQDDLDAVKRVDGVDAVMPAYSYDALALLPDKNLTVRLHSLSENLEGGESINRPELKEGRMPENSGECLADPRFIRLSGYAVGDSISFASGTASPVSEVLKTATYQIVGIAENPLYISEDRGSSSIGSGKSVAYFLIPPSDFGFPVYTELYLTVRNDRALSRFDDKYEDLLTPIKDALEETGVLQAGPRYDQILLEGRDELEDAKKQMEEGYRELDNGRRELDDARVDLDSGRQEYVRNKEDFSSRTAEGQRQLDEGYARYNQGLTEYQAGLTQYEKARADAYNELQIGENQLAEGRGEYEKGFTAYNEGLTLFNALSGALSAGNSPEAINTINTLTGQLRADLPELVAVLETYTSTPGDPAAAAAAREAVGQLGSTLEQNRVQLESTKKILDEKSAQLNQGRSEADSEFNQAKAELDSAQRQLADTKATLDAKKAEMEHARSAGEEELAGAEKKLSDAEIELAEGEKTYEEERFKAERELADAQRKVEEGEAELAGLKQPEWYVLDHGANPGYVGFKQDSERIDALSLVIPILFFLVAVLVTMTSMTRLVDSDRSYIGTYKAMGYSDGKIALRYLRYAVIASVIGGILGLVAGFNIFPRVIFNAYAVLYTLPPVEIQFDPFYTVITMTVAVACAALPAWFVCLQSLRESPATLMRPAAPRSGKRIMMEKIPFIWKKFNFSQKVAIRNLFRYKKRLIMTVFGVAGCTALMFTGFGLRDSLSTIQEKQYGNLHLYDVQINLQQDITVQDKAGLNEVLQSNESILSRTELLSESLDVIKGNQLKSAFLIVPKSIPEYNDFVRFMDRKTRKPIPLGTDGVIITEKLAGMLGVTAGQSLSIRDGNGRQVDVTVEGIGENYLFHYIFMSPELYRSVYGTEPAVNQVLCRLQDPSGTNNDAFSAAILDQPAVSSLSFTSDTRATLADLIKALRYVVLVLILSAAMLVFVVLFSLTSINLEERSRELATIKVLGFFDRELASYIYRENGTLTVIGAVLGLLLGVVLQRYIITTVEVDMLMFSRDLLWQSYVYAAGLTFVFAVLVNVIMLRHIQRIDMVSSLKSIE